MTSTHLKTSDISIIIPTFNEADNIAALAENLAGTSCEVIVVDGGSEDTTVSLAQQYGFTVVTSPPGRARQQNTGARRAKGRIVLFLHADTRLPRDFEKPVIEVMQRRENIAGAFSLAIEQPTPSMRFIAACANLRAHFFGLPYGDQALFLCRDVFLALNMFADMPIMEDYDLVRRAGKTGKVVVCREKVTTSARRWQKLGVLRTTFINQLVVIGFFLKVPPSRLALLYKR